MLVAVEVGVASYSIEVAWAVQEPLVPQDGLAQWICPLAEPSLVTTPVIVASRVKEACPRTEHSSHSHLTHDPDQVPWRVALAVMAPD